MKISFDYYPHGKKKALTMSYDDGRIFDRMLVDIFNMYGIKGTFHLNSGKLDTEFYLNASEIKKLYKGHEVSAHSLNHPFLTNIPKEALVEEILEDRRRLEALVEYPVRGMSYPFRAYNEELLKALPVLGIEYSRTALSHGSFILPENFLMWNPTCHHKENVLEKCKDFKNTPPWLEMPLFYVWGHSYEFDRDDNWELIEEFCKMVSHDETVWYATNIEVMDYIKALRNIKFSVNRKMVINPSCIPVWIGVDNQAVKVEPGLNIL